MSRTKPPFVDGMSTLKPFAKQSVPSDDDDATPPAHVTELGDVIGLNAFGSKVAICERIGNEASGGALPLQRTSLPPPIALPVICGPPPLPVVTALQMAVSAAALPGAAP